MPREDPIRGAPEAARDLAGRARAALREHEPEAAARALAAMAGAWVRDDHVEFGVWLPDLDGAAEAGPDGSRVELELFTLAPGDGAAAPDPRARPAETLRVPARRQRLPLRLEGGWAWGAFRGAALGTREALGSLYRVVVVRPDGREEARPDPLAASLPFGAAGPAELYDVARMHAERDDVDFFRRAGIGGEDASGDPPRFGPPAHLLEVHVGTATHGGTIADLADLYRELARKVRSGEAPTPGEACFLGFDAIELMPIEPVAGDPDAEPAFEVEGEGDDVVVVLRAPRTIDWGYDGLLHGAAAIEPSLLRSGRPDELVDLAAVLHGFPGKPIRLVLDVAFGHAHETARALLPSAFLDGDGEYGPRPALDRPEVRALLLEALRRKVDYGADGLRVDASHDLARPGPEGGAPRPDDAFLAAMSDVVGRVAEVRYRPFMIFEDGRTRAGGEPGPPSYRDVTRRQAHAHQWGPLTFGRAYPALRGYWGGIWWRMEETAAHGSRWVTGGANHDTLRRAIQAPAHLRPNERLGEDRPAILRRSYDHPAATLTALGFLPGVPLTFVSALLRAPWAFFRNVDDRAAPAVAAAEAGVLPWRFSPEDYAAEGAFERTKALGFHDHEAASAFFLGTRAVLEAQGDPGGGEGALEAFADAVRRAGVPAPFEPTAGTLRAAARAFLADLRDACVVWNGERHLDPAWVEAARTLRRARRERPWLARDLGDRDRFERRVAADGSIRVVGLRHAPDGGERLALLANLEGAPWTVVPAEALREDGWTPVVASPGAAWEGASEALELTDAEGVLLRKEE